jgi:hypothetical protein
MFRSQVTENTNICLARNNIDMVVIPGGFYIIDTNDGHMS